MGRRRRRGYDALGLPPGDADALAAAISRLIEDPELRERAVRRASTTQQKMLRSLLQQICPPIILNLRRHFRRRGAGRGRERGGVTLGANSRVTGAIERRARGAAIDIGGACLIEGNLVAETRESRIRIGNNVFIGADTILDCSTAITVEDDVLISYQCILADSDNHSVSYSRRRHDLAAWRSGNYDWADKPRAPIVIRRGAWLGMRTIVLKGVTIGKGAVVGAGSVVTRDVPDWTVAAGSPAKVIRELTAEERGTE